MKIIKVIPVILFFVLAMGIVACGSNEQDATAAVQSDEQSLEIAHDSDAGAHESDSVEVDNEYREAEQIENTDYQCPFCARHSSSTFSQIVEEMVDNG